MGGGDSLTAVLGSWLHPGEKPEKPRWPAGQECRYVRYTEYVQSTYLGKPRPERPGQIIPDG